MYPQVYNDSIEKLNELEKAGKAFIYRPEGIKLENRESDPDVLTNYYKVGFDYAASRYDELMKFLEA